MSKRELGYYCCCCGRLYQRLPNVEPLRCSCGMSASLGPYTREPRRVSCPHVGCSWSGWQDGVEDGLRLHLAARHRGQAGPDVPGQLLLDQAAVVTVALTSPPTPSPEGPMSEARWAEVRALRDQARQGAPTQARRPRGYAWHCSGDRGADLVAIEQALLAEQRALRLAQRGKAMGS